MEPLMVAGFALFGLLVGVLFGFFGMGGSFLVTPALLVLGYPAEVAVGSGLAFVFGTAIIAAIQHHGMGQVDAKLGAGVFAGTVVGIEIGKALVFWLKGLGLAESVISVAYIILLSVVGVFTLRDAAGDDGGEAGDDPGHRWFEPLRSLSLPPRVGVQDGPEVSLWAMLLVGLVTGVLAGLLGVGGGFILMPALVYGLGVPVAVAVGTDLFQIVFSAGFGSIRYAQLGAVDLGVVVPLLAGSVVGALIGAKATGLVDAEGIKGTFGGMLIAGAVAVGLRQAAQVTDLPWLEEISLALLVGSALVVVAVIAWTVARAYRADPGAPQAEA